MYSYQVTSISDQQFVSSVQTYIQTHEQTAVTASQLCWCIQQILQYEHLWTSL